MQVLRSQSSNLFMQGNAKGEKLAYVLTNSKLNQCLINKNSHILSFPMRCNSFFLTSLFLIYWLKRKLGYNKLTILHILEASILQI